MRNVRFGLGLAAVVTLAACEPLIEPAAEAMVDVPAPSLAVVGPVVQQVTGSAIFHRTTRAGETYRHRATFSARRHADGSVVGNYSAVGRTGPYRGRVHCFTVIENEAWLGVVVEWSKNSPPEPGDERIVYVMDNGEGAGARPDSSTAFPPLSITDPDGPGGPELPLPDLDAYCADTPQIRAQSVFELEGGNIQILP